HNYLPWLYHLLFSSLFVDTFLSDLVVLRNTPHYFFNRNAPVRFYIVFYERTYVRVRDPLPFVLRFANNRVNDALKFANISANILREVCDDVVRYRKPVLLDFCTDDGDS